MVLNCCCCFWNFETQKNHEFLGDKHQNFSKKKTIKCPNTPNVARSAKENYYLVLGTPVPCHGRATDPPARAMPHRANFPRGEFLPPREKD